MAGANNSPMRRLRVFLCHSSGDKQVVRKLHDRLERDGFEPWLDEKRLLPAQRWADVIEDAVRASDAVLVCLSAHSVGKEGFLQREIRFALQVADEKPDGTIYIVPTRLEPVELPRRFREYQAADLFQPDGYERLRQSLATRAAEISVAPPQPSNADPFLDPQKDSVQRTTFKNVVKRLIPSHPRIVGLGLLTILVASSLAGCILYRQHVLAGQLYDEGVANWRALKFRKAEDLLAQAAAAAWRDPRILAAYALSLNERGNDNDARRVASRARAFNISFSSKERRFIDAVYHEVMGQWQPAQEIYSELSHGGQDVEVTIRLAHVQTLGNLPNQALSTLQQIPKPASLDPRVVLERAMAQMFLGQFEEEILTLQPLIDGYADNELVRATALAERCWAEYNNRNQSQMLSKALADCRQAEKTFIDNEDSLGQARAMSREAVILSDPSNPSPDYAAALELQKRALAITRERGAARDEAGARHDLANVLMEKSPTAPEEARTQYEQSEELFHGLQDWAGMAGVENDASVRQIEICSYQDALDNAKKAQANWSSIGSANESIALANAGAMQFFLGDVRRGEANLKAALLKARGNNNIDTSNWLITLGEIYSAEAKFPLAEQCFKSGPCYDDEQSSSIHSDKILPDASLDYAKMQIELGQFKNAELLAEGTLRAAGDDADVALEARSVLANALLAQGSTSGMNRARALLDVGPITPGDCRIGVSLHLTLATIAERSGDLERERQELRDALQKAQDLGLVGYVLEARLEQAGAEMRRGNAASAAGEATQVLNESNDRGFLVLKAKAADLVRRAGNPSASGSFPKKVPKTG